MRTASLDVLPTAEAGGFSIAMLRFLGGSGPARFLGVYSKGIRTMGRVVVGKEFREKLVEELDEAFSVICQGRTHDEGLEAAADRMEEFLGMWIVSVVAPALAKIEEDIVGLRRDLSRWGEELKERRRVRERQIEEMEGKGSDGR